MEPTALLRKQHRQVENLFKKIEKTDDAAARKELLRELATNLELHMRIEEEIFYPAVRELETKKADTLVLESYEEHAVVRLVLGTLPEVDPEDERFEAKMTVLQELIEHHVEEEEKEMFKLARRLDDERLAEVGERMAAEVEAAGGARQERRRAA